VVIAVVGVSHHDASLAVLEELSRAVHGLPQDLVSRRHVGMAGVVSLSTCNRVEFYLDGERFHDPVEALTTELSARTGIDGIGDLLRVRVDAGAARHLFSVAAGLESMVVGEEEIAGQVRRALATARSENTTTPTLERLFQSASSTAKLVTSTTGLGAAGRSIVAVALDIVEDDIAPLAGARVLILGTGAYARVVSTALRQRGVEDMLVYSSSGRAARFVQGHGGSVVLQDDLAAALAEVDLVVACSGAPHHILDEPLMQRVSPQRDRLLPVIDLALLPDVDPAVRRMPEVRIIDLEAVRVRAPREHGDAVVRAHGIVNEAVARFEEREASRVADPVVVTLRQQMDLLVEQELDRVRHRADAATVEQVERSLRRLAGQLLHMPTVRARELARDGNVEDYHRALGLLFGVERAHSVALDATSESTSDATSDVEDVESDQDPS
jgi:glutamyl-tRNA reductase